MAAESELNPTTYIQHHLTFLTKASEAGGFWSVNVDTVVTSAVLGIFAFGFLWLVTRKATPGLRPEDAGVRRARLSISSTTRSRASSPAN